MGNWQLPASGHMERPSGVYYQTMNMTEIAARLKQNDLIIIPDGGKVFEVTDASAHHHVPLLLSPYAYSTYRGS